MLNPTHLRTLREVLAAGSFAEAATRLGYTPSAVSQQVAALERETGLRLFDREARSARPTPVAELLARRAGSIVDALDTLEREVQTFAASDRGVIRLGSFPTASAALLPEALARLRRLRPNVQIQLDEGEPDEIVPSLAAGGLDLALAFEYDTVPRRWPSGVRSVPLLSEDLYVLAPASRAPDRGAATTTTPARPVATGDGVGRVEVGDLRDETWIATRQGTAGERCLLQLCATAGFTPRIAYRSNDFDVVRGLVRSGLGVALIPAMAAGSDAGSRRLLPRGRAPRRRVLALTSSTGVDAMVESLLGCLVDTVRALADVSAAEA